MCLLLRTPMRTELAEIQNTAPLAALPFSACVCSFLPKNKERGNRYVLFICAD